MKAFLSRITLSGLVGSGCLIALTILAYRVADAVPGIIDAQADKLIAHADAQNDALREAVFSELGAWRKETAGQLTGLRADMGSTVKYSLTVGGSKFDAALKVADARAGEALATVAKSATVADGLVANSAALVKDLQDSLDANHDDARALLHSATVATAQAAQTMEYVRAAAPAYIATGQQIAEQFRLTQIQFKGIATDARKVADKITAPKRRWWWKLF